jgi:hypothetical protein
MLMKLSFRVTPSDLGCMLIDRTGGFRPTTVKKENGARLGTPSVEMVLSHPIARGTTVAISSL